MAHLGAKLRLAIAASAAVGVAAVAGDDWIRTRYLVEVDGPVPAARYTLIQRAPAAPPSTMRALLTDAAGRRLVAESRTSRVTAGGPPVRRSTFQLVAGGPSLALRFADPEVEIVGPGGVLAAYRHGEERRAELEPALAQVRAAAGPELLAALATYARIGLSREPAFRVDAVLLVDALFPLTGDLPLQPERRQNLGQTGPFDPSRDRPEADEVPFGAAYDVPRD
jgi:hypothetical protein